MSRKTGIIHYATKQAGYEPVTLDEGHLLNVTAHRAGIFYRVKKAGEHVAAGETTARILDPYDSSVLEDVLSPTDGTIFFAHNKPLALEHSIIYRLIDAADNQNG